ncbi:hypothetical protein ACOMHN_034076 [Nucella lapillus]
MRVYIFMMSSPVVCLDGHPLHHCQPTPLSSGQPCDHHWDDLQDRGKNVLEFSIKRPRAGNLPITVSKINLYVYVWKRREARRPRRNRRRPRKRLIKIRVFQVEGRSRKGKRIAELRKNVHSSQWHRLSLPVSVVHSMWKVNNGTLKLRVRCKRCFRKVQLILPADAVKCNRQRARRQKLKANLLRSSSFSSFSNSSSGANRVQLRSLDADKKCNLVGRGVPGLLPFMVIENKVGSFPVVEKILKAAMTSSRRSKRSTATSSASTRLPGPTRVCNPSPRHSECCVLAVPVDPAEYGMGDSIVAPSTLMATSCEGACPAAQRRPRRMRGNGRRGGRRKKGRQWSCQPVEQQALEIWYFDHNHELAHASLPGLVISQCACRRQ